MIADAPPDLGLLRQDLFIPLLVLVPVEHDAGAVERANDSPFALGASIFTRDRRAATRLAGTTRAGVVTINDLIVPTADPRLPFGGRSGSGFGVTRGPEGLLDLTVPKVITRSRGRFRPAFDPPHPGDDSLWIAALRLAHGRGLTGRVEALGQMLRALLGRRARAGQTPRPTS